MVTEVKHIGEVRIADDVVGVIAKLAASEIEGISGMNTSIANGLAEIMGKKNHSKGIKVQIENGVVKIDAHVTIDYGVYIPETAKKVQANIKRSIETMTGLSVDMVNVFVQGIAFNKDEPEVVSNEILDTEE